MDLEDPTPHHLPRRPESFGRPSLQLLVSFLVPKAHPNRLRDPVESWCSNRRTQCPRTRTGFSLFASRPTLLGRIQTVGTQEGLVHSPRPRGRGRSDPRFGGTRGARQSERRGHGSQQWMHPFCGPLRPRGRVAGHRARRTRTSPSRLPPLILLTETRPLPCAGLPLLPVCLVAPSGRQTRPKSESRSYTLQRGRQVQKKPRKMVGTKRQTSHVQSVKETL